MSEEGTQGPHCTETVGPYPKISKKCKRRCSFFHKKKCLQFVHLKTEVAKFTSAMNLWNDWGQNDPWRTRKVQMHRGWNWLRHSCPVLSGFWAKSLPRCRAVSKTATSQTYRRVPMEKTRHIVTSLSYHIMPGAPKREDVDENSTNWAESCKLDYQQSVNSMNLHTEFPRRPGLELDQA